MLKAHPAVRKPMRRWMTLAARLGWSDIHEARQTFPSADAIRGTRLTCFNIAGNRYRLIVQISYVRQEVYIEELMTHASYSKKYSG